MQKLTRYKTHSLAVMMLALLLCAAHSAFAYERLFTHSHEPLTYHQHPHDHLVGHHWGHHGHHHGHHHDHSGAHHHNDSVPLTNENLPAHLVTPSSALIVTKMISASHTATYLPQFVLASIVFVPVLLYRSPVVSRDFKPPTSRWLLASLTLAPNSPPTI